ncbi:MAG TPA: MauE/DoxX family redox-associated membrane protein [Micromonospora sp.]
MRRTTDDVTSTPARSRWRVVRPWLGIAARFGLAAVFLLAGASKVGDLAASGRAVNAYRLMPYELAAVIGAALPFVELALGVLLLLGLATRLAAGVAAGLLVIFIAGIGSAWARGLAIDCGCFGSGGELPAGQTPGYGWEVLRDLGFLVLAGFLLHSPLTPVWVDHWLAVGDRLEGDDE